jgi:hypothetical protein
MTMERGQGKGAVPSITRSQAGLLPFKGVQDRARGTESVPAEQAFVPGIILEAL